MRRSICHLWNKEVGSRRWHARDGQIGGYYLSLSFAVHLCPASGSTKCRLGPCKIGPGYRESKGEGIFRCIFFEWTWCRLHTSACGNSLCLEALPVSP